MRYSLKTVFATILFSVFTFVAPANAGGIGSILLEGMVEQEEQALDTRLQEVCQAPEGFVEIKQVVIGSPSVDYALSVIVVTVEQKQTPITFSNSTTRGIFVESSEKEWPVFFQVDDDMVRLIPESKLCDRILEIDNISRHK